MKRFDASNNDCPKCGSLQQSEIVWDDASNVLVLTCNRCGFRQDRAPLDEDDLGESKIFYLEDLSRSRAKDNLIGLIDAASLHLEGCDELGCGVITLYLNDMRRNIECL